MAELTDRSGDEHRGQQRIGEVHQHRTTRFRRAVKQLAAAAGKYPEMVDVRDLVRRIERTTGAMTSA
ncbi:hypothetical protein [Saccharothrix syringae]|uniref:Uncharacterized protein n=1 Tax=Saccharothrix syringae TaxID=103733 RepID=A0A5Q0H152_SACSY|nr:hypothetical protein [Saccharothrix syringae]QFZ19402.1 hypothetical protein EKG83_19925 [Saccharothrix syringae]